MIRRPPTSTLFPYTPLFRSFQIRRSTPEPPRSQYSACPREQRSEEHTSELQSLRHLVCRLLLEKKKIDHRGQHRTAVARHCARQRPSVPAEVAISLFFFFNDTATTEIYTLSLHDALPIWTQASASRCRCRSPRRRAISSRQ